MWKTGTSTSYTDLLDDLNSYLTTTGSAFDLSYAGTGNGTFTAYMGGADSVAETFTIEATSATNFTVTGSVTGALSDATAGTPYTSNYLCFTITAGGTAFVAGDTFLINTAPKWTAQRSTAGSEYIWTAPGNDGTLSLYMGAMAFTNVTGGYYNLRLGGFSGFNSGVAFASQPGAMTRPVLPLWNSTITYWFIVDGRRAVVICKVSTYYESAYLGLPSIYATPGQYPYPVVIGGSMSWASEPSATSSNWAYTYNGDEHRAFFSPPATGGSGDNASQLRLRLPSGNWQGFFRGYATTYPGAIWPHCNGWSAMRANLDASLPLLPFEMTYNNGIITNAFGTLSGVYVIPGTGLAAEDTVTIGIRTYLIVPNVYRVTAVDFAAVELN